MEREKYRTELDSVILKADEATTEAKDIINNASSIRQRMKAELTAKDEIIKSLEKEIAAIKEKAKVPRYIIYTQSIF